MRPALVVLAAGASSRLGRCKATVDLGGRTPLERLVAAAASAADGPALVVTGAHHEELLAALPPGAEALRNPGWADGRTGGVARAAAARPGRDLWIAPADVPLVAAAAFGALLGAWEAAGAPARGWLAPRHGGRHGHPVLVGRALARLAAELRPGQPLRDLRDRAEPLLEHEVADRAVLDDLDTPADLQSLIERLRG